MSEHAEAHAEHAEHDHRPAYWMVFGALLVGTAITVGAAQVDMGRAGNITVGVIIGCIKACLVGWIFMHLKDDTKVFTLIALLPIILFFVMIFLLLPDVGLSEVSPLDVPKEQGGMYVPPAPPVHH